MLFQVVLCSVWDRNSWWVQCFKSCPILLSYFLLSVFYFIMLCTIFKHGFLALNLNLSLIVFFCLWDYNYVKLSYLSAPFFFSPPCFHSELDSLFVSFKSLDYVRWQRGKVLNSTPVLSIIVFYMLILYSPLLFFNVYLFVHLSRLNSVSMRHFYGSENINVLAVNLVLFTFLLSRNSSFLTPF